MSLRALPVFRYHSVAPPGTLAPHRWLERISVPLDAFEATLADLSRRNVRTVGTDEIAGFLSGRITLPRGSVALTFDDGYLDNWVGVAPLLERYGHKAIIFVSTDFIDPTDRTRSTVADAGEVRWQGYLSAAEMRAMTESGVAEIQSHARTHTWYPISPRIVDFYRPDRNIEHERCRYRFLWLNRHPELKPFALEHLHREAVPWGTPVYEFAPALVARRYFPDPELERVLVEFVNDAGGESFFERPDWNHELHRLVDGYRDRYGERGSFEGEEARRRRVRDELAGSRARLEEITGRPVRFLAPPQGGSTPETLELARECGYELVTAKGGASMRLNRRGDGLGWVHRVGVGESIFGTNGSRRWSLLSQRIVAARAGGSIGAAMLTRLTAAGRGMARMLKARRG